MIDPFTPDPNRTPLALIQLLTVLLITCSVHGISQENPQKNQRQSQSPIGHILEKPGAIKGNRAWKDAWRFESPNFVIRTNISPEAAKEIAKVMEGLLFNFNKMFRANIRQKIEVLVPKNRSEYNRIKSVPEEVRGWFSSKGRIVTYYQPKKGFSTTDVLLHEGTHMVVILALTRPHQPDVWVSEGTAVYFEASEFEGTNMVIGKKPKHRLQRIKQMIKKESYLPIRKLIQKPQKKFNVKDYAQAWSLVYYLIHAHDHKWLNKFNRYLASFRNKPRMNPVRRFKMAFRTPIKKLQKDWLRYVKGMDVNDDDTVEISNPAH